MYRVSRLRALAVAALATAAVFYYLAAPALRALLGPLVLVPAYAAVSLLVGAATYVGVRYLLERVDEPDEAATEGARGGDVPGAGDGIAGAPDREDDGGDEHDVERMLRELGSEREE